MGETPPGYFVQVGLVIQAIYPNLQNDSWGFGHSRDGLHLAPSSVITLLEIELDVGSLSYPPVLMTVLNSLFEHYRYLIAEVGQKNITHVSRDYNSCADALDKKGFSKALVFLLRQSSSSWFKQRCHWFYKRHCLQIMGQWQASFNFLLHLQLTN